MKPFARQSLRVMPLAVARDLKIMRCVRILLFALLAFCLVPVAAQAQYVTIHRVHDWNLELGDFYFGLTEDNLSYGGAGPGAPVTTLYLGRYRWATFRFGACELASFGFLIHATGLELPTGVLPLRRRRSDAWRGPRSLLSPFSSNH